jgi:DNA-binding response OmpR family regulator
MEQQKTILIVEDDVDILYIYSVGLKAKGFSVLTAENGKDGVALALTKHPDLILLDLIMPEMDGMTAFKEIRQDVWGANVPVFILTNLNPTSEQLIKDVVVQKPLFYMVKSDWKLDDIADKINEVLKK